MSQVVFSFVLLVLTDNVFAQQTCNETGCNTAIVEYAGYNFEIITDKCYAINKAASYILNCLPNDTLYYKKYDTSSECIGATSEEFALSEGSTFVGIYAYDGSSTSAVYTVNSFNCSFCANCEFVDMRVYQSCSIGVLAKFYDEIYILDTCYPITSSSTKFAPWRYDNVPYSDETTYSSSTYIYFKTFCTFNETQFYLYENQYCNGSNITGILIYISDFMYIYIIYI